MKVLVVDDSVIFRTGVSKALDGTSGISVVGTAANGKIALERITQLSPDVITLDLEMPEMDGLTTIKEIRKTNKKIVIIVFSDQSEVGAKKTIEALSYGADDFVPKSVVKDQEDSVAAIRHELVPRVLQFKSRYVSEPKPVAATVAPVMNVPAAVMVKPKLIVLGCSTGGPDALRTIFADLKNYKGCPILIVQHMPPVFTGQLAKMLTTICGWTVKEGVAGEKIQNNTAYIAPGDYHMFIQKNGEDYIIGLNQKDKVKSVRPAADVLFQSVAECFTGPVLSIVLTGMGDDGLDGVKALKKKNAYIVIQDKPTSVVWGMPGAIHAAQCFDKMVPLSAVPKILLFE